MSKADDRRRAYERDLTPPERPNVPPRPVNPRNRCGMREHDVSAPARDGIFRCWYCGRTQDQIDELSIDTTATPTTAITPTPKEEPMSPTPDIALIDLSSIAYPIWHMSEAEPDTNHVSQQIVVKVRQLAARYPHAAICCDVGKSFRKDLAPTYKAQRPAHEAPLYHQIDRAKKLLEADGFPVWGVPGFEADDIIASATARALATPDLGVTIISADKDLLQLVGPRVRVMTPRDQTVLDQEAIVTKYGVRPDQVRDYLTLCGDASDNIKGVPGIGPKTAMAMLARFGTLDAVYAELDKNPEAFKPATIKALQEFRPSLEQTRALLTLRTDVAIPFENISFERVPKVIEDFIDSDLEPEALDFAPPTPAAAPVQAAAPRDPVDPSPLPPASPTPAAVPSVPNGGESERATTPPAGTGVPPAAAALVTRDPQIEALRLKLPYERQLDPIGLGESIALAKHMFNSHMFSAYGTPQGVLSTIMVGRELGIPAMASLRGIHNIEGRHALSAALMVAIVIKSGFAEYFEPIEFDDTHAVFETKRKGARNPVRMSHTIEMARTAGLLKPDSNWVKVPTDMCVARCQARLCRLVYPDLLGGLYTPDELREIALLQAA